MRNLLVARYVESSIHVGNCCYTGFTWVPTANSCSDTLLRHFKMHNVRRGHKILSLIIDRQSTDNLYKHSTSTAVHDIQSCEQSTNVPSGITGCQNSDAASESCNLNFSNNNGGIIPQHPSLHDVHYEMPHPGANVLKAISASTEIRSGSDTFSCNAITNLSDSTIDYAPLGTLADSNMEYNSMNWLLDGSFANIFDDWSMDVNGIETRNHHDTPQPLPTTPVTARESPKSPPILDLGHIWYIQVRNSMKELDTYCNKSGRHLLTTSRADIDELFRTNIAKELHTLPCSEPLPSLDFLVYHLPLPYAICLTTVVEFMHSVVLYPIQYCAAVNSQPYI